MIGVEEVEPLTIVNSVLLFLSRYFANKCIGKWLSKKEQQSALRSAMVEALECVHGSGYERAGYGVLDTSFLERDAVAEQLWSVLLDPTSNRDIDYELLVRESEAVYEDFKATPETKEAIELFVDLLIDQMWVRPALSDLLTARVIRQHDHLLTSRKKKILISHYLMRKRDEVCKDLSESLGDENTYVEPLLEGNIRSESLRSENTFVDPLLEDDHTVEYRQLSSEEESSAAEVNRYKPIDLIDSLLSKGTREFIVTAESGYGKTTLLRQTFLRLANLYDEKRLLPVLWLPREAESCNKDNIRSLLVSEFMKGGVFREDQIRSFVNLDFRDGNFVFLIDALDQIHLQSKIIGCFEGSDFSPNYVVLSSRPMAYDQERLHLKRYEQIHLRAFDRDRWSEYLGESRAAVLRGVVNDRIFEVPLLLKLVVQYWSESKKSVDSIKSRTGLYRSLLTDVLDRQEVRDATRRDTGTYPSVQDMHHNLRRLSYHTLMVGYLGQFRRSVARKILGQDLLCQVQSNGGILELLEMGDYFCFRHRSFQEFLAAEYLLECANTHNCDFSQFESYLFHPNWEEPIRFLAGLLDKENTERLVRFILQNASDRPLTIYHDEIRLACLCLTEMEFTSAQLRNSIVDRILEDLENPLLVERTIGYALLIYDPQIVSKLISLGTSKYSRLVRKALEEMRSPEVVDQLVDELQSDEEQVRQLAIEVLGNIKAQEAIKPLMSSLEDPSNEVKELAIRAFREIKAPEAAASLIRLLYNDDENLRVSAYLVLQDICSPEESAQLIRVLQDGHGGAAKWAAELLGKMKSTEAVAPLIQALRHENSELRESSVKALAEIGSPESIDPLIQSLLDRAAEVRASAAYALGELRCTEAQSPLMDALMDDNENVRACASRALGQIQSLQAVHPLILLLEDQSEWVRLLAAEALGEIGSPEAIQPLGKVLGDNSQEVSKSAAASLSRIKSTDSIKLLIRELGNRDELVQRNSALTLAEARCAETTQLLIEALGDNNEIVVKNVSFVLGKMRSTTAIVPLIEALATGSENSRIWAAYALGQIKSREAVKPLINALSDQSETVKQMVAFSLGELGSPLAVHDLITLLRNESEEVRVAAIAALGRIRSARAVEPLSRELRSKSTKVRYRTVRALREIETPEAVQLLVKALADRNEFIRLEAVISMFYLKPLEAVKPLSKIVLSKGASEYDKQLGINALGKIGCTSVSTLLIDAIEDKSEGVRDRAVNALGNMLGSEVIKRLVVAYKSNSSIDYRKNILNALVRCDRETRRAEKINHDVC